MNHKKDSGFTAVEAIIILLVVIVVGGAGWLVYKHDNKTKPAATNSSTHKSTVSKSSTTTKAPNPYAGWKAFTTQHDKMHVKYPSTWSLADNTAKLGNGYDFFTVTAPDGNSLTFQALVPVGAASPQGPLVAAQSIKFLGQNDYMQYYSNPNTDTITTSYVSTSKSALGTPKTGLKDGSVWDISVDSSKAPVTYAKVANDADFQDAKLIVESAAY
ncbi:MAG TPA: hypothetical protein VGG13_00555 [Candidatus Saccharimonadales bacterium]|jgi:hypothetical protein